MSRYRNFRATCTGCHLTKPLRADDTVWEHKKDGARCPGSRLAPAEEPPSRWREWLAELAQEGSSATEWRGYGHVHPGWRTPPR